MKKRLSGQGFQRWMKKEEKCLSRQSQTIDEAARQSCTNELASIRQEKEKIARISQQEVKDEG